MSKDQGPVLPRGQASGKGHQCAQWWTLGQAARSQRSSPGTWAHLQTANWGSELRWLAKTQRWLQKKNQVQHSVKGLPSKPEAMVLPWAQCTSKDTYKGVEIIGGRIQWSKWSRKSKWSNWPSGTHPSYTHRRRESQIWGQPGNLTRLSQQNKQ